MASKPTKNILRFLRTKIFKNKMVRKIEKNVQKSPKVASPRAHGSYDLMNTSLFQRTLAGPRKTKTSVIFSPTRKQHVFPNMTHSKLPFS